MNDRFEHEGMELPPELAELDAELSSIRYEERPSFGPELEAELEEEWRRIRQRRERAHPVRRLAAAVVAGLLLVGLGVPSARASLVRIIDSLQGDAAEASAPLAPTESPLPLLPDDVTDDVVDEEGADLDAPAVPADLPLAESREPYAGPPPTFPELSDRERVEALIQQNYPVELQREGVGGTVRLLLWVDSRGAVDFVNLGRGSGVPELDRVALGLAPSFDFTPAVRRGRTVGTWVEFDVRFEPGPNAFDPFALPEVEPILQPQGVETVDLETVPEWEGDLMPVSPVQRETGELLRAAIGDDDLVDELGSMEAILRGDPPAGMAPTSWRFRVGSALERAVARQPDNPAPFLALARLRREQGLRTEARLLFERGLQRAQRADETTSPSLLAELHYERGALVKESWLGRTGVGKLPAEALDPGVCPQARSTGGASSGFASVERLVGWNYMCPAELGEAFRTGWLLDRDPASDPDLQVMMASFRAAVEAYPAHVGANVEILLALADEERWRDVLDGARRFVWASQGHPYGLLLSGLALQRLARTEEADGQFRLAFRGLPGDEEAALKDVRHLVPSEQASEYRTLDEDERADWLQSFWAPLDPILNTEVNERTVEHLARATYAYLRFGTTESDPAEVWIRYGRPNAVRVVAGSGSLRTEFWDYGGGPDITLRRMASSSKMDLTPEGRAYLDDLREVLPHWYGTRSRTVFSLPGQVTRFRGQGTAGSELEVVTEVPEILATGEADTLDLGVFLLSGRGDPVSAQRRKVTARPAPVSLKARASRDVAGVVVEFFNRETGQAAALRRRAHREDGTTARGATISDLMVTEAASPDEDEVRRSADWIRPHPLTAPLEDDAVGVLFELYDVKGVTSWYRVRAELENRETGAVQSVPIRPAGEPGFRATWDRRPTDDGSITEFYTLALNNVDVGRYTVRMVVDLADAGMPLVAERDLDRR